MRVLSFCFSASVVINYRLLASFTGCKYFMTLVYIFVRMNNLLDTNKCRAIKMSGNIITIKYRVSRSRSVTFNIFY